MTRFAPAEAPECAHVRHARWMKRHTEKHGVREVTIGLEGNHFYGVRNRIYRVRPGTVILFDHHEAHDRWYSPFQPDSRGLWLHLTDRDARRPRPGRRVDRAGRALHSGSSCGAVDGPQPRPLGGLHAVPFNRLFRKYTGAPVHQFVNQARLTKARRLLTENMRLKAVAEAVGFGAVEHFSRLFRREYGVSPLQWQSDQRMRP